MYIKNVQQHQPSGKQKEAESKKPEISIQTPQDGYSQRLRKMWRNHNSHILSNGTAALENGSRLNIVARLYKFSSQLYIYIYSKRNEPNRTR